MTLMTFTCRLSFCYVNCVYYVVIVFIAGYGGPRRVKINDCIKTLSMVYLQLVILVGSVIQLKQNLPFSGI